MPLQHDAKYLEPVEQEALKQLAAHAIRAAVPLRSPLDPHVIDALEHEYPRLRDPRGAFVTIHVAEELRGCLGDVAPSTSLARVVARCAEQVTHADYRFNPLRPEDLQSLTFKLSVLTPPRRAISFTEIVIGRDGLLLTHQGRTGVLLPEVASERAWDVATFVEQLRRKAGVPANVPLEAMQIDAFETQVIEGKL